MKVERASFHAGLDQKLEICALGATTSDQGGYKLRVPRRSKCVITLLERCDNLQLPDLASAAIEMSHIVGAWSPVEAGLLKY